MGYTYVPTKSGRAFVVGMWTTWVLGCLFVVTGVEWPFAVGAVIGIAIAISWYATLVAFDIAKWIISAARNMRQRMRSERPRQ